MRTIFSFFLSGGVFMWPLLLLSVAGLAVIIERLAAFRRLRGGVGATVAWLASGGKKGSPDLQGIEESIFSHEAAKAEALAQERLESALERFLGRLDILGSIGNIAPLVGFIGTVSGMISSFSAIAGADRVSVRLIAGGISEALITTAFGLIIAIPCVLTEQGLRHMVRGLAHAAEDGLADWNPAAAEAEGRKDGE